MEADQHLVSRFQVALAGRAEGHDHAAERGETLLGVAGNDDSPGGLVEPLALEEDAGE